VIQAYFSKIRFDLKADRLGPDCPFTHWKLYFPTISRSLLRKMFFNVSEGVEVRPGSYTVCCSRISLGKNVIIRPTSMLFADPRGDEPNITIEDNVMMGSGVHIYTSNHSFQDPNTDVMYQGHTEVKPVKVKKGAWIGANCIILPGVTIGENSVVGAGSVITKSVPNRCLAVGNPAKVIKEI